MANRLGRLGVLGILVVSLVTVAGIVPATAQTRPALVVVQNTSAQPVPVVDAANPAFSPLRLSATGTVSAGFVGSFGMTIGSALAADTRLVIEFVSFDCGSAAGAEPAGIFLTTWEKRGAGSYHGHTYPMVLTRGIPNYTGTARYTSSQSLRLYHDGGQALQFGVMLSGPAPAGGIVCSAEVSGYTVPMQ